jgi:hypothetical protein
MILVFAVSADDAQPLEAAPERPRRWRPSWLGRRFLRVLEIVLRWIFFDAHERKTLFASRIRAPMRSRAETIKTVACADGTARVPDRPRSKPRLNVLIAGRAKFTDGLLRCLLSEDVNVHAIAVDREEARDLIIMGAAPHALEDIPDQASQFDVVISTDLMQFIGAEVLAGLPDHAVVLDLAPPPGSVDYESAKRLGRKAIWARSAISEGRAVFCPGTWGRVRHVLELCQHGG